MIEMKNFYLILAFAFVTNVFGQSFVLKYQTDTVWSNPSWLGQDVSGKVKFENTSTNDIYYKAKQAGPVCGLTLESSFCVGIQCYPPTVIVSPDSFLVAAGAIDSSFSGHILTPYDGFEGCCPVNFTFFDNDNPNDSLQVEFIFCSARGISVEENEARISAVYPNPAVDYVTISYDIKGSQDARFRIINVVGQVVMDNTLSADENSSRLDISRLESGVYFYSLELEGRAVETKRLVISK